MAALLAGCATGTGVADGTDPVQDAGWDKKNDTGGEADAGGVEDAGVAEDTGFTDDVFVPKDTGAAEDTGEPDGGVIDPPDVGADAGAHDVPSVDVGMDAGPRDVGVADSGPRDTGVIDSGPRDTGPIDAGTPDTGTPDTGPVDTGPRDTGPVDTGTPDTGPACTPTTEVFNSRDDDCDGLVDEGFSSNGVSLACTGSGLVVVIDDDAVQDGGGSSGGDDFLVFCINGTYRFCLSGEACPWRAGTPAVDDGRSCSSAGLAGPAYFMAYFITGYFTPAGGRYDEWYCPPTGRVRLALR